MKEEPKREQHERGLTGRVGSLARIVLAPETRQPPPHITHHAIIMHLNHERTQITGIIAVLL